MKTKIFLILISLSLYCHPLMAFDHPYPRIGLFHFGTSAPSDWYAKFDFLILRTTDTNLVQEIKSTNPDAVVFGTTDWNYGASIAGNQAPEKWRTFDSNGMAIHIYSANNKYTANFSEYCGNDPDYQNKKFNEYLPGYVVNEYDQNFFDGICTDGIWIRPRASEADMDIDLDRNGQNDYNEHGANWVRNEWKKGVDKVIASVNSLNGNRPLILNTGRFHLESEGFDWSTHNGLVLENNNYIPDFGTFTNIYQNWMAIAREPHFLLNDGKGTSKNDFYHMRYLLGITMHGDGYFDYAENDLHHYHGYYDEFDLNLGYPTGDMQQLRSTGSGGKGVWVRFFDEGAVILNVDDSSTIVHDSELNMLPGYNGPYYRFKGGQVPEFNNGHLFDEIALSGGLNSKGNIHGDAILLTRHPTTVVSDIYIDSDDEGTSPGSSPAFYSGTWSKTNDNLEKAWCLSYRGHKDAYAVHYATDGSGTATFTPTIGVAGEYHVYEWHGDLTTLQEASNVAHTIHHAGGTTIKTVDQNINFGQWNSLGKYNFDIGCNGNVVISAVGADGTVIADGIKFVYESEGSGTDLTEPTVTSAKITGSTTIEVNFSEPVKHAQAGDENNYTINNGVTVYGVSAISDRKMELTTDELSDGITYILTIQDIQDLADNILSPNPTQKSIKYEQSSGSGAYAEDFDDGMAQEWVETGGTWSLPGGKYRQSSGSVSPGFSYYSGEIFSDFTVEADITVNAFGTHDPKPGLLIRYIDENNYYAAHLAQNSVKFARVKDGTWNLVQIAGGAVTLTEGQTYHMKVICSGNSINVEVDGCTVIDITDDAFGSGYCGVWVRRTDVSYDNFEVY